MTKAETLTHEPAAASALVASCEEAWRSIQGRHPDVPDVVLVLGTGVERGRLVKLGHWWGGRWLADGIVRGEVLLAGEALHLRPVQVFEVLLHEAAHGLNAGRRIKDTSRGGRYHNARYKATAEELRLLVTAMPPYGWAQTELGPEALLLYASDINRLGQAMRIARRLGAEVRLGEQESDGQEPGPLGGDRHRTGAPTKARPAECGCGRKMRMAPSILAKGPVLCGLCQQEFATEQHAKRWAEPERNAFGTDQTVDGGLLERRPAAHRTAQAAVAVDESAGPQPSALQHSGLTHLTDLAGTDGGVALIAGVGAWREAQRQGDPRAIVVASEHELRRANDAARALLKVEGELVGSPMIVAGRELLVGELVIVGRRNHPPVDLDGRELPPAGVLGTVVDINAANGIIEVDFPIVGRHRVAVVSEAATILHYGYAEHAADAGAPLVDLRTLPDFDSPQSRELCAASEQTWYEAPSSR